MTYTEKRLKEFDETISNVMGICTIDSLRIKDFLTESITQAIAEERERVRGIIDWELTPHGYESDDKYMEHFACELKEKYKNKILSSLDKPIP